MTHELCIRRAVAMTGRTALWMLLQRFMIERGKATQVELTQLLMHTFNGDLELYLDGLDTILMSMHKTPDEELLHGLIEPQLRRCSQLSSEFVFYDARRDAEGTSTGSEGAAFWRYS